MLFVFLLLFHPSAGADYDQSEPTQFLHKTPSRQLERMFTAGPFDREITLSFNTDSQEEEHNEIRRSVPEVRILGDRVIPLSQLSGQEKLIRFARSTGPSFDLPAYDFMVPAEKQENSSALAVLKFSTPDGGVTTFSVNMDRLKWFEIGGQVKRTQVGDRFEYEVPVLLAAGADVRPELTKNSVYKFNVEAKQGKETVSSRVRVEILSFSPTTRRVKATTTDAITSSVPTVETTTENARVEKVETGVTGVTRGDEALPTANTLDDHSVEGSAEPDRATSAEKSQNVPESTSTSVSSGEPSSSDQRSITEDQLLTTPTVQRPLEQKKMSVEVEGSGVPETKSLEKSSLSKSVEQDDDDPLSEVVTMAVPIQQKETIKGIDIDISGPTEGVFVIDGPLHRGDLIRGLVILATSKSEDTDWLSISIDRPELFSVRPKRIEPGGKAYLFSNHPHLIGDIRLKITISDGPVIEEVEIVIKHNKPKEDSISTKIDFSVKEDAPSGTIIGHIDHGNEMKIIGKAGLFALMGDDLLLSCSSEAPCLDYESQHLHYLLLAAKDGSAKTMKVTVTVIDLNDNAPYIEATDSMLRISDGQLTMPFAVQIVDEDSPSAQRNELSAAGDASDFLELEKVDVDLYQVRMKGSPAPGKFELVLRVDDGVHHSRKTHKTVKVLVQNSHSHAHFRRPRYERNILREKILPGVEVVRVELEGLPIDEARFVVSRMNPGWLTIDDYGGTVSFTSPRRIPAVGQYDVIIAALSRETGRLLAQTTLSIKVLGTPAVRRVFEKSVYEKTIDREASDVEFSLGVGSPVELDKSPLLAIDEDGLQGEISSEFVTVRGDKITVSKEAVPQLRVIRMDIISGQERATVLLHLTSSNEFLEHNRKMASKPLFPAFPDLLEVAEELPTGHVVATIPAVHPLTGELVPVRLEGGDGTFALDSHTGALKIASPMDYDKPGKVKEMMLTLHAGEEGYETVAKMKIRLVDVDDNPPNFSRDSLPEKIVIPENTPLDTVVMRVPVTDVDEISQERGLRLSLLGASRGLFKVMMANGTAIVQVAEELDREKDPQHVLQLVAEDSAGHKDAISVTIELSDVNDNSPVFSKELYDVQAVENWPAGLTLETLVATDADSMERGQVVYSLQSLNSKYFTINSTTGKFQIAQDLMGLARVEPYLLTAVATDRGSPPRNSTVRIRLSVTEPRKRNLAQLSFTSPPMDYILELKGELSPMDKIYQVKARLDGDGRNIKYSLKELLTETNKFSIDEMSGELMVKEQLKGKSEHILLVTARHLHSLSGVEAVRILRVRYNPTTRADPFFPDGSPLYFPFKRLRPLGSIEAATEDGGEVFYYIIPSCSPHTALFALNSTSGELTHTGPESPKAVRVELCVIATTEPVTERANLRFDKEKRNNIVVEVVTEHDEHPLPDIHPLNNTVTTLDSNLSSLRLRMDDLALVSSFNFSIAQVSFIPSETVPPLATAAPLSSLFSITRGGIVRPSPSLSTQPSGVYTVQIDGQSAEVMQHLVQEFHLVPQTSRLRLVFDKQVVPVAKEYPAFEKEFKSTVTRSSEDAPRLVLDQPRVFHSNMSKASVCFHAVGQESLLSGATTISLLSKIADLYQVYNKFGVVDIVANCDDPVVVEDPMSVALSSPASLFAASVLAFSLLFFFMIFVYFCFVRRYRDYLRAKEKSLKGPPQIVPSNPTFVLTPPQLVHQQSTAPLTYWE